jgi:hypothetical protein
MKIDLQKANAAIDEYIAALQNSNPAHNFRGLPPLEVNSLSLNGIKSCWKMKTAKNTNENR